LDAGLVGGFDRGFTRESADRAYKAASADLASQASSGMQP
jgi:hypothetical protein